MTSLSALSTLRRIGGLATATGGLLIYFKYLEAILNFLTGWGVLHGPLPDIVLPLGISFFTFTQIG